MIHAGDIAVADLGGEMRCQVIVISSARFHQGSQRAIVVPELRLTPDELLDPWRFVIDRRLYAADHLQSMPIDGVLEVVAKLSFADLRKVQRTINVLTNAH